MPVSFLSRFGREQQHVNPSTKRAMSYPPIEKIAALPLVLALLSACSTTSTVEMVDARTHANVTESADVAACWASFKFFKKETPDGEFETLAKIESHVQRNFFFGRDAKLEDAAYDELKTKTCKMGGNAVIINDYVESRAAEFSHVHVWATSVKLP
jgi:hypothetical protein